MLRWYKMNWATFWLQTLILSCLLAYETYSNDKWTHNSTVCQIICPLLKPRCSMQFYQTHIAYLDSNKSSPLWHYAIHIIHSLHLDMANDTFLIWALVYIDLFLCTRCPTACTSGAPQSRVIAGLGSLVPEPLHGAWHSSVSHAPHPCLWSHPRNSLLSWNLQCISSGNPGVSNDAAEGSSAIKLYLVCEGGTGSCDSTCQQTSLGEILI